ncbi:unnamed protein product [Lymnaea stagnalis]|uniref:Uncharacterized protein n=1 Tax=Lymnaea stagnalis TaxID=6523 RepID=A0AAV2H3B3_LYMST
MQQDIQVWKNALVRIFGKRAKNSWKSAVLDFKMVDHGIKMTCLFDRWLVCAKEMIDFVTSLHNQGLIKNPIGVLAVGVDVIIYNEKSFQHTFSVNISSVLFVDITSTLKQPTLINEGKVLKTKEVLIEFLSKVCPNDDRTMSVNNMEISEELNVPTLFGLLLGYPIVYWYDRSVGEDNCLTSHSLTLFQVKGYLSNKDLTKDSSEQSHVIFSFSAPQNLFHLLTLKVRDWFFQWKECNHWQEVFCEVILKIETVNPQAVCL